MPPTAAPMTGSPHAIAASKELIRAVSDRPIDTQVCEDTARRIAQQRASAEGREGVTAFLEKRAPHFPNTVSADLPDIFPSHETPKFS